MTLPDALTPERNAADSLGGEQPEIPDKSVARGVSVWRGGPSSVS